MNDRSCDHMIDTEAPYCWVGLVFPRDCRSCSRYLQDSDHWDDHREKVWQQFVVNKSVGEPHPAGSQVAGRGVSG